jgi:hypothetical protein
VATRHDPAECRCCAEADRREPSPADKAAARELVGRKIRPFRSSTDRVEIRVHPNVRDHLHDLLQTDPRLRGVGYSQFINDAIEEWENG